MSLLSVLLTTFALIVSRVQGQSQCTTPDQANGYCKPIKYCSILKSMVLNPNRTNEDIQFLKDSVCDKKENTICCPKDNRCFTPDADVGKCVPWTSCHLLINLLRAQQTQENIKFFRNSRCGDPKKRNVCCGTEIPKVPEVNMANCVSSAAPPDPRTECCGVEVSYPDRIYGGNITDIGKYPWLTLIEYRTSNKEIQTLCGGTLISNKYVLTASHCVTGLILATGTPINVRLGEYDTSNATPDCIDNDCTDGVTVIPIESFISHQDYDPSSPPQKHDIALIRLQESTPYTDYIRPICLPTEDITLGATSIKFFTAGWGATEKDHFSSVKLDVELPYISMTDCQLSYNAYGQQLGLWNGQICAGGEKGKDSCKGDSGGPLMSDNGKIFTIDGIVSFGPIPCGIENVPGVYTKVYEYLPWIRTHMKP